MVEPQSGELRLVIRTPHGTALDGGVSAVRVPTETGLVGLRPRGESLVLAVEAGLVAFRSSGDTRLAATAGGLLESDRECCTLYTPFAVVGDSEERLLDALEQALAEPNSELAARRQLGELEQRILRALNDDAPREPTGGTL